MNLGESVRESRRLRGMDLPEVAAQARLDPIELAAFEGGEGTISTAALARVARALGTDVDALRSGDAHALFTFRQGASDFFHDDAQILRGHLRFGDDFLGLHRLLGTELLRDRFAAVQPSAPGWQAGYRLARELRIALGDTTDRLPDVKALAEDRCGVLVRMHAFHSSSVRATAIRSGQHGGAVIALSSRGDRHPVLRRGDLAHELCHVLFDRSEGAIELWREDDELGVPDEARLGEQRAKAFAAELLVPLAGLELRLGKPRRIEVVQRAIELVEQTSLEFIASREIVTRHLANHGYLDPALQEDAIARARQRGVPFERFEHDALSSLVTRALAEERISRARAAEILA